MSEVPAGNEYRGPMRVASESIWLTNEDLPHDRDTPVTIATVVRRDNVTMQEGRKKAVAISLRFVGKQRELMLNATNRKTLALLFESTNCADWFGKRILLHVVQGVRRPDGTVGPAVRIRPRRVDDPAAPAKTQPPRREREPGEDG